MATKEQLLIKNDSIISFSVDFTNEQKEARRVIHNSVITILFGKPGTSKTLCACSVALELLMRKTKDTHEDARYYGRYDKVIVTRPMITAKGSQAIGTLPGGIDIKEGKIAPYLAPIVDNFEKLVGKKITDELIEKDKIVALPLAFARGITFSNAIVIVDESQNMSIPELALLTSRIGHDSKLVLTSDLRQCDLRDADSSAAQLYDRILKFEGVSKYELTTNYRHPLAIQIWEELQN